MQQNSRGDRNQIIVRMYRETAIANLTVKRLIQHFHLAAQEIHPLSQFLANWSSVTVGCAATHRLNHI